MRRLTQPRQKERPRNTRFSREFILFKDRYKRLSASEYQAMFKEMSEQFGKNRKKPAGIENAGQHMYLRKFGADFSKEMSRSVRLMLQEWKRD